MKIAGSSARRATLAVAPALVFAILPSASRADTLVSLNLNGNGPATGNESSTSSTTGDTATLTRNGTVSYSSGYGFNSHGYVAGTEGDNTEAILTVAGPTIVSDLAFGALASNTGPATVDVYEEVDGATTPTFLQTITVGIASTASYDITLNQTIVSSLDLFFSADVATKAANSTSTFGSAGTFRIDDPADSSTNFLAFNGTTVATAVPLPSGMSATAACLSLVGASVVVRKRRLV